MAEFENMEQRIINMYKDLFPTFKPYENKNISVSSQKQFYDFMVLIFQKLFENPLLLFTKTNPDDFFIRRFNKNSENKKEVYAKMKKIVKTLDVFYVFLYNLGKVGNLENNILVIEDSFKISKKYLGILEQCNVNYSKNNTQILLNSKEYPDIFYCWKWLSTSSNHSLPHFIGCMFDLEYQYTSEIYSKLSNNEGVFKELEGFLIKNNYLKVNNLENKINLDYVKEYDKKNNDIKGAWAERTHGGISAQYDTLMKNPPLYSLRVPYYKNLLQQFDKMPDETKEFVTNTGKKCDNCRYCVQMDKTGKKPFSFVTVNHKNNKYDMCTYFPGFNYCWEILDQKTVNNIISFLIFADKILKAQ